MNILFLPPSPYHKHCSHSKKKKIDQIYYLSRGNLTSEHGAYSGPLIDYVHVSANLPGFSFFFFSAFALAFHKDVAGFLCWKLAFFLAVSLSVSIPLSLCLSLSMSLSLSLFLSLTWKNMSFNSEVLFRHRSEQENRFGGWTVKES